VSVYLNLCHCTTFDPNGFIFMIHMSKVSLLLDLNFQTDWSSPNIFSHIHIFHFFQGNVTSLRCSGLFSSDVIRIVLLSLIVNEF